MLLRSLKVPANTLSKYKQSGDKIFLLPCPELSQRLGVSAEARPRPPRVLLAIAANTPRAAFASLRCSSVTCPPARPLGSSAPSLRTHRALPSPRCVAHRWRARPPARAHASVVDLSSPCSLSRLQVSKRSETEAESTIPSKLFTGKIPPPLRWVFVHFSCLFHARCCVWIHHLPWANI